MAKYVAPAFNLQAFNCPHCGAYAAQAWFSTLYGRAFGRPSAAEVRFFPGEFSGSNCANCGGWGIWRGESLIFPLASIAPLPHDDMPENVAADFREARDILARSPRSSAALLRLALQKLCIHLGEKGENINGDIGQLVKKGLSPQVQQAMDTVRIVGNNAVHPGELDVMDNHDVALGLFSLVNLIVHEMITRPREIAELYGSLPQGARDAVEKRDKSGR